MGSWSVNCGISNIAITSGNKCVLLPLKENNSETRKWQPATLPIFGEYNDYGGIENIEIDDNTKLIEEHFGITIAEFAEFLVDGKFTYNRSEVKPIIKKMKKHKEAQEWQFMWIDRQVYDFMTISLDEYHKGYNSYGTPEMLKLLGFTFVEKSENLQNYDPKRFNQLWRKGDVEVFSDNDNILSKSGKYVYHYGKGCDSSIETYFEVPKELEYLKTQSKLEAWRLMSITDAKNEMCWILGNKYYSYMQADNLRTLYEKNDIKQKQELHKNYFDDLEKFGDKIVQLISVSNNLHPMSGQFVPHVLYLTPQCGEYETHQKLLEKFAEINKSYLNEE